MKSSNWRRAFGTNCVILFIGVEKFVQSLRKSLKEKQESRKQSEKIIAAVDPARELRGSTRGEGNGDENWEVDEVVLYQGCTEGGHFVLYAPVLLIM
jgi:hypothetical protein